MAFFRIASLKPLVKNQTIVSRAKALVTFARQSWENVRIFVSAYFKVYVEEPFLYASEKLLSSRAKRIFALFVCTIFIVGVGALAWHNVSPLDGCTLVGRPVAIQSVSICFLKNHPLSLSLCFVLFISGNWGRLLGCYIQLLELYSVSR